VTRHLQLLTGATTRAVSEEGPATRALRGAQQSQARVRVMLAAHVCHGSTPSQNDCTPKSLHVSVIFELIEVDAGTSMVPALVLMM